VEALDGFVPRALVPEPLRDAGRLLGREFERLRVHERDVVVDVQARQCRRWVVATYDDHIHGRRQLGQAFAQHFVQRRIGGQGVVVVENPDAGAREAAEQCLKVLARKQPQGRQVLGGQARQRFAVPRRGHLDRLAEVVKKAGDVVVAFVDLVPEAGPSAVFDIAARERGLAGARRAGQPHNAVMFVGGVDGSEQALARVGRRELRPLHLGRHRMRRFLSAGSGCFTPLGSDL
jgi:hypothetical protein